MVVPRFSPICEDIIEFNSEYLHTATNLEIVVAGNPGNWYPKVRGIAPDDGATVTVAWYPLDYMTKAEATHRAREMLKIVKYMRK